MRPQAEAPFIIALNLTQRCNLACDHCYLDAKVLKEGATDELSTDELRSVLDDIAALSPECMVVLTGGEPLMRPDIEDLAAHASAQGLMVVVGSNGILLTPQRVATLRQSGVAGIGISLDSLVPEKHDTFRGRKGAWDKTMASIDACVAGNLLKAKKAQKTVAPLARLIYNFGEPGSGAHQRMKVALWLMGNISSPVFRRPLRPLKKEHIDRIRETLNSIGYKTVR